MPRLPPELVAAIQEAAVQLRLDRGTLLSGISPAFAATIPNRESTHAQILTDLHALNSVGSLPDGADPLRVWLINASALARESQVAVIFVTCLRAIGFNPGSSTEDDRDESREKAIADLAERIGQHAIDRSADTPEPSIDELCRLKSLFGSMVYLKVEQTGLTTSLRSAMPTDGRAWDTWVRPTIESTLAEAKQILELLKEIARNGDDLPLQEQALYRRLVACMRERVTFYTMFLSFRFDSTSPSETENILRQSLCDIESQYRRLVNELHDLGDALEDYIQRRGSASFRFTWDSARLRLANAIGNRYYHQGPRDRYLSSLDPRIALLQADEKFRSGDYSEALARYRDLDGYVAGLAPCYRIALCLDELGRRHEALEAYYSFLERHPNLQAGGDHVAHARERINQLEEESRKGWST